MGHQAGCTTALHTHSLPRSPLALLLRRTTSPCRASTSPTTWRWTSRGRSFSAMWSRARSRADEWPRVQGACAGPCGQEAGGALRGSRPAAAHTCHPAIHGVCGTMQLSCGTDLGITFSKQHTAAENAACGLHLGGMGGAAARLGVLAPCLTALRAHVALAWASASALAVGAGDCPAYCEASLFCLTCLLLT